MAVPFRRPKPAPPAVFNGRPLPWRDANVLSKLLINWIVPMVNVAWSRDIAVDDLYELTPDLQSQPLGDQLESSFMKRVPPSLRPMRYRPGQDEDTSESDNPLVWSEETPLLDDGVAAAGSGKYDQKLFKALWKTFWKQWCWLMCLKVLAITLRIFIPLLMKTLITQLTRAHEWHQALNPREPNATTSPPSRSVGYMMLVGVSMWVVHMITSILSSYIFWRARFLGETIVSALTAMISRKSKRLSAKSRVQMTNGRIITMVSADSASILRTTQQSNEIVGIVIQLLATMTILFWQLGYSAFVGLAVLLSTGPLKVWMFKYLSTLRRAQNNIIDERVKLLSEVLNNIRAVKLHAYDKWFINKIGKMRKAEMNKFQENNLIKSTMASLMTFLPNLAAILTFIVYASAGHRLDPAIVFSSLQYYSNLRTPIRILPENLTDLSRAWVGLNRIQDLLKASELEEAFDIDPRRELGIDIEASFQFEQPLTASDVTNPEGNFTCSRNGVRRVADSPDQVLSKDEAPFSLKNINLRIPKGSLVCVVGRVGTGKTALLLGMLNEMRRTDGYVRFGGKVSYVPQQAWVLSGTLRENIAFSVDSQDIDQSRVEEIIDACALRRDMDLWPDRDLTEIGERGITLSGGQRQRICIARATYSTSDIVLLDDPLSAVDAHVGHHLLEHCILNGPMSKRTRILVTHQFDILPKADMILVVDRDEMSGDGGILQSGTFAELVRQNGLFQKLFSQYGGPSRPLPEPANVEKGDEDDIGSQHSQTPIEVPMPPEKTTKLILDEDKAEGVVGSAVFMEYARSIHSWSLIVLLFTMLIAAQVASVFNSLFLGYWSENKFEGFHQSTYMIIYAGLGVAMAILNWNATFMISWAGIRASYNMFNLAWKGVMRSPTSWHDRTPTGRVVNRLSKDFEILDDGFAAMWLIVLRATLGVIGALALILYAYPYAILVFIPILVYDYLFIKLYRQTSRELNRLVPILRSNIYINLGEQLDGLHVIRAFNQQDKFEKELEKSLDTHLSAVMVGVFSQGAWLGIRISLASNILVLAVVILGITFRKSVSAAQFGVVLYYIMMTTGSMNGLIVDAVNAEQMMNIVERVQYYTSLPPEGHSILPSDPGTDQSWPDHGQIAFENVEMRYRPELPLALNGISFVVGAGEKIGVIGTTGAGKSSIVQALFRTVEISGGKIKIDGTDIRVIGLNTLRQRLSIIPQDAFLFDGTIRGNLDPTGAYSDSELNEALDIIHKNPRTTQTIRSRLKLETLVSDGGSNFSAGERQLVVLVRAIVKGSKILVLDEATSSVDPETDIVIQEILQTKFKDITLIAIAHRLQTVAYYDKILVMDRGLVVEYDNPLTLFDNPVSFFRTMCNRKGITEDELLRLRYQAGTMERK